MSNSILALKLTDEQGRTMHGNRKLQIGGFVRRRRAGPLYACGSSAVHAYRSLWQARRHDGLHCCHGSNGILWLVELHDWQNHNDNKLIGTSYKVLSRLGRIRAVTPAIVKAAKAKFTSTPAKKRSK